VLAGAPLVSPVGDRDPGREERRPRVEGLFSFLSLVFTGWLVEGLLLSVIPLVVLERGGDASTVGLVALAYALPSLVARPLVGRFIDRRGFGGVQLLGGLSFAVFPLGYLVPGLQATVVSRLLHGVGWSLYGTASNVLMAMLAPIDRRAELSGYVSACRAIALVIGPIAGLWLYSVDPRVAIVAAAVVGAVSAVLSFVWRRAGLEVRRPVEQPERRQGLARFVEPSSLIPMFMLSTFISSQMLFLYFAPVYVDARGIDLAVLAFFYPAFGLVLAVAPLLLGRVSDRLGRGRTIRLGCGMVIAGLVIAALPMSGFTPFMAGAIVVGLASSMVTAAIGAATIDRAVPSRLGSAMATYSMGFQLASGFGALLWGTLITAFGFPVPFLAAILLQVVTITLERFWRRGPAEPLRT
jgi:DHA1 family multidrug resistance protein-like MFS transporter